VSRKGSARKSPAKKKKLKKRGKKGPGKQTSLVDSWGGLSVGKGFGMTMGEGGEGAMGGKILTQTVVLERSGGLPEGSICFFYDMGCKRVSNVCGGEGEGGA